VVVSRPVVVGGWLFLGASRWVPWSVLGSGCLCVVGLRSVWLVGWPVAVASGPFASLPCSSFLVGCAVALVLSASSVCAVWGLLCPLLLLFPLCPFSVPPLLSLLLLRLVPRCCPLCLVLGGLLLCRLWRCRCLVWTRSPWSALTGVSVSVVLPMRLVRWVVRSRWTSCSPVCRLVLGRLFGSVLRSGTRLTRGLLVLKPCNVA